MNKLPIIICLALCVAACTPKEDSRLAALQELSTQVKRQFAPDRRGEVYEAAFSRADAGYVLRGATTVAEAHEALLRRASDAGISLLDSMKVLPDAALEGKTWGVAALSVINLRYAPEYEAESATQVMMGTPLQVLDFRDGWARVRTPEGYIAFTTSKSVAYKDQAGFEAWRAAEKVIVNRHYTLFRAQPRPDAEIVSDGVWGNLVEWTDSRGAYYKVRLPHGREAYVSKFDAQPFKAWLMDRKSSVENIIATARQFVGFPYLWAGTSVKGMDCSGLVKTSMFLNGVITLRDASQMAKTGDPVDLGSDYDYKVLRRGDVIFFGRRPTADAKERISHVGIYLGDAQFIHSATYVRINSLNPADDNYYEGANRLVRAARFAGNEDLDKGLVSIGRHPWYVAPSLQ